MPHEHSTVTYPPVRWAILAACSLASACFQLAAMSYPPLLGEVAKGLNVELPKAVQLMTYFMLFSTISFFVSGPFVDRFGPAVAIIASVALASIPTLATLWIGHSYAAVVIIRILQGCSVGFCMAGTVPLVMQWFPPHQRAFALGVTGAFLPLGAVLGSIVTPAAFIALGDWRTAMAVVSIIPFAVLAYCLIVFGMTKGRAPASAGGPADGASSGDAFKAALISPPTWLGVAVTFVANWLMQTAFSLTPSYFTEPAPAGLGLGPLAGGSLTTILQVASIIAPVVGGYIAGRFFNGRSGGLLIAGLVLVITYGALQFQTVYDMQAIFVFFLILPGLGIGLLIPMLQTKIAASYEPCIVGRMNGLWLGIGSFGGAVGLFVSAEALAATGTYIAAVNIITLIAFIGAVLAAILNRTQDDVAARTNATRQWFVGG